MIPPTAWRVPWAAGLSPIGGWSLCCGGLSAGFTVMILLVLSQLPQGGTAENARRDRLMNSWDVGNGCDRGIGSPRRRHLVGPDRHRLNENAPAGLADALRLLRGDGVAEDGGAFGAQRRPVRSPVDVVPVP